MSGGEMENIIYERNYEEEYRRHDGNDTASTIFEIATDGGFIAAYADAMQAISKIVVPADKENYEYLLQRSDKLAQRWSGKVRGVVNYEKWEATIDLVLPFAEFCDRDDLNLLKEFADKSHTITFQTNDDGKLRIHIFIFYFEEIADKDEIFESILRNRPDLTALLDQYKEENPILFESGDEDDNLDDSKQVELMTWFVETWAAATGENKESVASAVLYELRHDYKNTIRKILDLKHKLEGDTE